MKVTYGAPAATGDVAGYVFSVQNNLHVVYRSEDNHIQDLEWNGRWDHHDLTGYTGGVLPASDLVGYGDSFGPKVFYRGSDGHIYELYWNGSWYAGDVSYSSNAPAAEGKPTGLPGNTDQVFYRGADSHIHALQWNGTYWVHTNLTTKTGAPNAAGNPSGYHTSGSSGTLHVAYRGAFCDACDRTGRSIPLDNLISKCWT